MKGKILIPFLLMLILTQCGKKNELPIYGTFEITVRGKVPDVNPFTEFVDAKFSDGTRQFNVEGFYDGNNEWKVRFMPDKPGIWFYSWNFHNKKGEGQFVCTENKDEFNHGHVKTDPENPRYLISDDGLPFFWFGGKWINAPNYGPPFKGDIKNDKHDHKYNNTGYYTDDIMTGYLDSCRAYKHNGLLLKLALYPLENDKISWDLEWIKRGEWLVREMGKRGIYCQINYFDTWSRKKDLWFDFNDRTPGKTPPPAPGTEQVFNVWNDGDDLAKENYIRNIIARFSGYYNVYWELGNEMEHGPHDGKKFAEQANLKYIPWIKKYDPYNLPVCLSENVWKKTNVDVGLLHQTNELPPVNTDRNRPVIMNELVRGGNKDVLWKDSSMRDSTERTAYRRTFWNNFVYGGCGSSEATWLEINKPLNREALQVMGDQQRLRDFIEKIPVNINEMFTDTSFVRSGPGKYRTRSKQNECYITYFTRNLMDTIDTDQIYVNLPEGNYTYRWYDPSAGLYSEEINIISSGTPVILNKTFKTDIVLSMISHNLF